MEKSFCKNNEGQSVVEYLLLLLVVVTLGFAVFRSEAFRGIIGPEAAMFQQIKIQKEYSFRHSHPMTQPGDSSDFMGNHHSYKNPDTGRTRFFSNSTPYPR